MTDRQLDLSRRRVLAGLGTIGVASAGAGLGTSAYFSDREEFTGNTLTAGQLDAKVAASEYYSDWSPDEAEFAGMASSAETTDVRLPAPEGNPDAQDIALDLDNETENVYEQFVETLRTGDSVNGGVPVEGDLCGTDSDADGAVVIDIDDVKPGDFGGAQFAIELCDNPGYLWLNGILESASENGVTEPEADDPDEEEGVVELLDEIQVAYGVGSIQDSTAFADTPSGFQPTNQQSLREFLATASDGNGIPLAGDIESSDGGGTGRNCFSGSTVHEVSLLWWLPVDHANQIQTDSASFALGFYTEQCRHNDGSGMAPEVERTFTAEDPEGVPKAFDNGFNVYEIGNLSGVSPPTVGVADSASKVTFQVDLTSELTPSNPGIQESSFSFPVDANDDGTTDFELSWHVDPNKNPPNGENFYYREFVEGVGPQTRQSLSSVPDINASYDPAAETVTVEIGRARLEAGGDTYRFGWQEIYTGNRTSNDGSVPDEIKDAGRQQLIVKVPFSQPRWKFEEDGDNDFADSDNFAVDTLS